jgi:hypothetical protein
MFTLYVTKTNTRFNSFYFEKNVYFFPGFYKIQGKFHLFFQEKFILQID